VSVGEPSVRQRRGLCDRRDAFGYVAQVADSESDFDLLDRWRTGDKSAGQSLLERHFDTLCGFFESKLDRDADDLVQRTMLACVASKDRFRKESSFRTYLFTVARHELFQYLRSKQRDGDRLDFSITSIAQILTTPASRMIKNADKLRVIEALRQLSVEQQTLLELFYWQELDVESISEVFELEPGTTRVRLHRARKKLRELLELPDDQDEAQVLENAGKSPKAG
jgi:RNA polymerase sigma factor (sigma-70 family)